MYRFPKDFFWGASTSSYQVEGNNIYSDWWHWEKKKGLIFSGDACRHYELYQQDFDLAKLLNHNAHRFSIEWARVEPQEGKFNEKAIQHYKKEVVLALKERNLEPIVTLNHFTLPYWLAQSGGWLNKKSINYFLRYVEKIVYHLNRDVKFWITINEPMVYIYQAYLKGVWPPEKKSILKALMVYRRLVYAHIKAYHLIHRIYKEEKKDFPCVSIAQHLRGFFCLNNNLYYYYKLIQNIKDYLFNFMFLDKLVKNKSLDFIGINYYTSEFLPTNHPQLKKIPKSNLGWFVYPEGLYTLLLKLKRYNLDIFILENGISTDDDNQRISFIRDHLKQINLAMQSGINILGYLYWSLIDNFEWDKGFMARFGLIEIDYSNFKRNIRESARMFSRICKNNYL